MIEQNAEAGWFMVFISSLSCVLGASIVFLEKKVLESQLFLSASMALGGGVLLFNSFYTLLPACQQKLDSNVQTVACFFIGVLFTTLLTYFIQWCTPKAIHTCSITALKDSQASEEHDRTSLVLSQQHHHHHHHQVQDIEYGTMTTAASSLNNRHRYFLIGMQTAIAICIHKFPEGLIMFISNKSSSQLGFNVAAAMSVHNLIEGFLIALPLYYATGSRFEAFSYAAILGGMSQPIGAVLGLLVISNVDTSQERFLFGILFGVVSGMMYYIAVQSMLPQAIRANANHCYVFSFFFIGILMVGVCSLLHSI